MTVGRLSQQPVEVLLDTDPKSRLSSGIVEVLLDSNPKSRLSLPIVEILFKEPLVALDIDLVTSVTASFDLGKTVPLNTSLIIFATFTNDLEAGEFDTLLNISVSTNFTLDTTTFLNTSLINSASISFNLLVSVFFTHLNASSSITSALLIFKVAALNTSLTNSLTASFSIRYKKASLVANLNVSALSVFDFINRSSSQLTLSQSISAELIANRSINQSLLFNQTAAFNADAFPIANSQLIFNQVAYGLLTSNVCIFQSASSVVLLPPPLLDDTENIMSDMVLHRSYSGNITTYLKRTKTRRLGYTFRISRLKSLELETFINNNNSNNFKMINWKGELWERVRFLNNPFDFVENSGPQEVEINLELEGEKVSA